jgi:hypothetical protein
MAKLFPLFLLSVVLLFSCSDKYMVYKNLYSFKSTDGRPDYSNLDYWAAHPWKKDPSDSVPEPLQGELRDSVIDVFFLHPTSFTKSPYDNRLSAAIDDTYINAKTDYSSVLYQASVFNQHARVFAPRYRQANISVFFSKEKERADSVFEMAYSDLKTAFEYYLKNWNADRPILIASHSQGSKLAIRLLKEYFEDKPLQNKLVVAYTPGWPVPKDYFTSLKMCSDSLQTGCICSWRTFRENYIPSYLKNEKVNSFVTNPLNWTTDSTHAGKRLNSGSVLYKFNRVYKQTTDARISNGLLWVKKPKFPWSFLYRTKNYHIADINLFYLNIRYNVQQRISSFNKQ